MTVQRSAASFVKALLCLAATILAIAPASAQASNSRAAKPVTVAAKFTIAGQFAAVSNGAFAFEQTSDLSGSGILIDQANGRRYTVPGIPGCSGLTNWITSVNGFGDELLASGRLIAECASTTADQANLQIYRLPAGPWTSFALPTKCAEDDFGGESMQGCNVDAAGRNWIELDSFGYHEPDAYSYQSLESGEIQSLSPRSAVSLDSSDLRRRDCSRLSYPVGDLVTVFGHYAIDTQLGGIATAPVLESCGGALHERVFNGTRLYGANNKVVLSLAANRTLQGIFLPSRQRFMIKLPLKINPVTRVALTSTSLYLFSGPSTRGAGRLWSTPVPAPPSSRRAP